MIGDRDRLGHASILSLKGNAATGSVGVSAHVLASRLCGSRGRAPRVRRLAPARVVRAAGRGGWSSQWRVVSTACRIDGRAEGMVAGRSACRAPALHASTDCSRNHRCGGSRGANGQRRPNLSPIRCRSTRHSHRRRHPQRRRLPSGRRGSTETMTSTACSTRARRCSAARSAAAPDLRAAARRRRSRSGTGARRHRRTHLAARATSASSTWVPLLGRKREPRRERGEEGAGFLERVPARPRHQLVMHRPEASRRVRSPRSSPRRRSHRCAHPRPDCPRSARRPAPGRAVGAGGGARRGTGRLGWRHRTRSTTARSIRPGAGRPRRVEDRQVAGPSETTSPPRRCRTTRARGRPPRTHLGRRVTTDLRTWIRGTWRTRRPARRP